MSISLLVNKQLPYNDYFRLAIFKFTNSPFFHFHFSGRWSLASLGWLEIWAAWFTSRFALLWSGTSTAWCSPPPSSTSSTSSQPSFSSQHHIWHPGCVKYNNNKVFCCPIFIPWNLIYVIGVSLCLEILFWRHVYYQEIILSKKILS